MKRVYVLITALLSVHCSDDSPTTGASAGAGGSSAGGTTAGAGQSSGGGVPATAGKGGQAQAGQGDEGKYPDAFDPNDSPPKIGEAGCGFERAAFCDTFGGASKVVGRGGELDSLFWSVGRGKVQLSNVRAIGIGMASIPQCREGLPNQVWPNDDCLVCQPTNDVLSGHFLAAVAAQNYGQNGYRIRQPFDFAGRTGKIVFDGTVSPMDPLRGWISLAITDEPMLMPGYSIQGNDEGSIIPKNAVAIHWVNAPGDGVQVRNIHVFRDFVDTLYTPATSSVATYKVGKLNHYEVSISPESVEVTISPYSEDGVTFAAPTARYKIDTALPFTRGWVQLSVHNHATLKYTEPPNKVNASVALFDNVGFDGKVIANWREYEIPNSLVKFTEDDGDPYNVEHVGYDVGYLLQDAAQGPKQTLKFQGVNVQNVESARLAFTINVDYLSTEFPREQHTFRARLNGGPWLDRTLTAAEAALLDPNRGPVTIDPSGVAVGDPGSQGRYALTLDVPVDQLVPGENAVEFVSSNVPTAYPPVISNVDLVLKLSE
jgi:hypothetical protein